MFLLIRVTTQLSPMSPDRHLPRRSATLCCILRHYSLYPQYPRGSPVGAAPAPGCPQGRLELLRVPPGVCSIRGLSRCVLSLAAFPSETVRLPTQMGLNRLGVTKAVKSPPVACMRAEPEQIQPEQSPKIKSHGSAFWFYFSKDFANESEKNLKKWNYIEN